MDISLARAPVRAGRLLVRLFACSLARVWSLESARGSRKWSGAPTREARKKWPGTGRRSSGRADFNCFKMGTSCGLIVGPLLPPTPGRGAAHQAEASGTSAAGRADLPAGARPHGTAGPAGEEWPNLNARWASQVRSACHWTAPTGRRPPAEQVGPKAHLLPARSFCLPSRPRARTRSARRSPREGAGPACGAISASRPALGRRRPPTSERAADRLATMAEGVRYDWRPRSQMRRPPDKMNGAASRALILPIAQIRTIKSVPCGALP